MENIQEKFFSKNNISLLNNKLLENLNVKNLNEKNRIYIAQTLVNIMKTTWKTINISKIRPENFQSVLSQFNSIVYKNSLDEINKLFTPSKNNIFVDPVAKKFERDFNSTPNKGVIVHDRPISMIEDSYKHNSVVGPNEQYIKRSQERHNLACQPDRNLDNLFRPIIDEVPEEAHFNNYTVVRGGDSKEKLQDIQKLRDTEVPLGRKGQSDFPDFLKPKATSVRSQEDFSEKRNIIPENNNRKQQTSQQHTMNFIDGADDNENLFSLDNIDKPLINDDEYQEDHSSFDDRFNKLKSDRDNIQMPKQRSIDFKSDNFEDDFNDIQPSRIDKLKNKNQEDRRNNYEDKRNNQEDRRNNYEEDRRRIINHENRRNNHEDRIRNNHEDRIRNNHEEDRRNNHEEDRIRNNHEDRIRNNHEDRIRNNHEEDRRNNHEEDRRNNHEEDRRNNQKDNKRQSNKITSIQREIFDKLKALNKNLMTQLTSYKDENTQLRCDNLELAEKLQEIIHKEKLLIEKEKELNEKYSGVINTTTFQLEINPKSSISNYRYNFIKTLNVSGIKLAACSIPFKKYNIEYDINNLFLFTINNIEKNIILPEGFYTIQEIIDNLNLNQNYLVFELNSTNQKIKITSESNFNIIPTTLSIMCMGFKSNYNNNNIYNADTVYDLRINNKVYLYFKNISDEPISIITPNTTIYDSELLFENPIKLNYLDIEFKDENDNNYNFYNISHYIHLNLITNNE
jgi:hypothetical protein